MPRDHFTSYIRTIGSIGNKTALIEKIETELQVLRDNKAQLHSELSYYPAESFNSLEALNEIVINQAPVIIPHNCCKKELEKHYVGYVRFTQKTKKLKESSLQQKSGDSLHNNFPALLPIYQRLSSPATWRPANYVQMDDNTDYRPELFFYGTNNFSLAYHKDSAAPFIYNANMGNQVEIRCGTFDYFNSHLCKNIHELVECGKTSLRNFCDSKCQYYKIEIAQLQSNGQDITHEMYEQIKHATNYDDQLMLQERPYCDEILLAPEIGDITGIVIYSSLNNNAHISCVLHAYDLLQSQPELQDRQLTITQFDLRHGTIVELSTEELRARLANQSPPSSMVVQTQSSSTCKELYRL